MRTLLTTFALLAVAASVSAQPEYSRREYSTPGLVLDLGGRTGACDVLTFTPDGQYLLAAGDDKVVRNWKVDGRKLEPSDLPALRWAIWRETGGNMYAAAVSPKKGAPEVAVGGNSKHVGGFGLAVIDRHNGKVLHALKPAQATDSKAARQMGSTWAMEYNRTGDQLLFGTDWQELWVWDLDGTVKDNPRRAISAPKGTKAAFNRPYLVAYAGPGQAVVVDQPSRVRLATLPARGAGPDLNPRELHRVEGAKGLRTARLSPDRKWLALGPELPRVEVLSFPNCQLHRTINFKLNEFPHSLAFDKSGDLLAVGIRVVASHDRSEFLREDAYHVRVYDLRPQVPRLLHEIELTGLPDGVAFSPLDSTMLATAGGSNHEVSLWDLRKQAQITSTVPSPGRCIWGLGLSANGETLAFRDVPQLPPSSPNERGAGRWRCFDLKTRTWLADNSFQPRPNAAEFRGWRVITKIGGKVQAVQWYVQGPGQAEPTPLPWDRSLIDFPRCYTFLPPLAPGRPVRLAVGHYWGVSVFDLVPGNVRRSRILFGHDADVMALAATADGKKLVSAGRDMTINGWNLEDWTGHADLGASFGLQGGKLMVTSEPAKGSPAWETGLSKGDEVLLLAVGGDLKFNRLADAGIKKHGPNAGSAAVALAALQSPAPLIELYFAFKRKQDGVVAEQLTKLLERPVWRFFPTARKDWVLWRWRDFYYDTRTTGDHLIGWVESMQLDQTPKFIHARDRSADYLNPDKVAEATQTWSREQEQSRYDEQVLPVPELRFLSRAAGVTAPAQTTLAEKETVKVSLTLKPPEKKGGEGSAKYRTPDKVYLWVNDHLFRTWDLKGRPALFQDQAITEDVPVHLLRQGRNDLTLQVQTQAQHRADAVGVLEMKEPRGKPNLYVLLVAVSDYSSSKPWPQKNLRSVEDARVMEAVWQQQGGRHWGQVQVTPLFEQRATQENVLAEMKRLAGVVKSDDVLILQMGGHGVLRKALAGTKAVPKTDRQLQDMGLGRFLFLCANFSGDNLKATTIGVDRLYEELVKLPCVKLLIFDACHSGEARKDLDRDGQPLRLLTEKRIGPIILAACKPDQTARELAVGDAALDEGGAFGIFTAALRQVLDEQFTLSDRNDDRRLQASEVAEGVDRVLRQIVALRRDVLGGAQELDEYVPETLRPFVLAVK